MFIGGTPFCKASSTMLRSLVVFPVPGGPNILNIFFLPFVNLPYALLAYVEPFSNGGFCHVLFVDHADDLDVSKFF